MTPRTLTLRELNRALLARHTLLERAAVPVYDAIENLAGLHAQIPVAPYLGLWSRLAGFQRDDLASLIDSRQVVKATLMRGTLHFFTADDYVRFRSTLQPALSHYHERLFRQYQIPLDPAEVRAQGEAFLRAAPRTFKEISDHLASLYPGVDLGALRQVVRNTIPLVQVPVPGRLWSYPGNPAFTLAEPFIGRPIDPADHMRDLFFRYLGAFGPAAAADFKPWVGIAGLKDRIDAWKPDLVTYRDEQGRELLDLPDAPLPDPDTPAPPRFIHALDNLLIGHADRTRIIKDEYRSTVMNINAIGSITFLIDGFVRGNVKIENTKGAAVLTLYPFEPITKPDRAALLEEADSLLRFVEPDAQSYEVQFVE